MEVMNNALKDNLPDDLILIALSFLNAKDLLSFQSTCSRYLHLDNVDDHWRALCWYRWKNWPSYALNERLNLGGTNGEQSWKQRYRWVEGDYKRTEISNEELESFEWAFNFLPWAGGSPDGQSRAFFHEDRLYLLKYLWMYPSLPCNIVHVDRDDVNVGNIMGNVEFLGGMDLATGAPLRAAAETARVSEIRFSTTQYLQIGTFPMHYIGRTAIGGWLVWNENVVFFSDGSAREAELPDQLEIHLDMFRF
jgi:hypothetical protein